MFENAAKNVEYLKALAVWIFHRAARNLPEPPDENRGINRLAISLHPERWEADGLYSDDGISLVAGARDAAGDRGDGPRGARSGRGGGLVREWT